MVPILFQQGDLDYYELTPADLNDETLRKRYRSRMLCVHPDKTTGSSKECVEAQAVHDRLKRGLWQFQKLQRSGQLNDIYECVSYKPARIASCRNLLQLADIRLAPTWHPQILLDQSWYSRESVQHALRNLSRTFVMPVDLLGDALQCLKPGRYFSALCNIGAVEHSEDTSWSFHGTSFAAMYSILLEGFLGVFGAGRYAAFRKFGVDLPVVYVSPRYECAARYPLALATLQGKVIGEYVADDVYPLRVILQCFAPVSKRRIKIRSSKTNHQDAYLPEDVSVHSVIFVACGEAPECQGWVECIGEALDGDGFAGVDDSDVAGDGLAGVDDSDDAGDVSHTVLFPRDDDVDDGVLEHQVHNMLLRLRIHDDDPRTAFSVAEDMLDLIDLREQFRAQHQIMHRSLGEEEFTHLWQGPFKDLFFEDERRYWSAQSDMLRKKQKTNSRFYTWVRRRYGTRNMVRAALRFGISSRIYQFLATFTKSW